MSVSSLVYKHSAVLLFFLMGILPAQANNIADAMLSSVPPALEEWSLQTDSKETDANGVKAAGIYSSPAENRLFVIEMDAGGQIVATNAAVWDFQMLTATVLEIGGLPYQVGPDGLTALIDGKLLIRAYSPNADELDTIKKHLEGLDVGALEALAEQLQ